MINITLFLILFILPIILIIFFYFKRNKKSKENKLDSFYFTVEEKETKNHIKINGKQ